jgi:hypothetical protein
MTPKANHPAQIAWQRFNPIRPTDGVLYNFVFRKEGDYQSRIQQCCDEYYSKLKELNDPYTKRKKRIAREIIQKYKLKEKFILNLLKLQTDARSKNRSKKNVDALQM